MALEEHEVSWPPGRPQVGSSSAHSGSPALGSGSPVDLGLSSRCQRERSGREEIRAWEQLRAGSKPLTPQATPAVGGCSLAPRMGPGFSLVPTALTRFLPNSGSP